MSKVFLISGKRGSGKDTVANYISKKLNIPNYSFARSLKSMTKYVLHAPDEIFSETNKESRLINVAIPKEHDLVNTELTPRQMLIDIGTYLRDNYDKNIWVDWVIRQTNRDGVNSFTVSDCRYINEIERIKDFYGEGRIISIRVERDSSNIPYKGVINDASETQLDDYKFDYVISNDGLLEELYKDIDSILKREVF